VLISFSLAHIYGLMGVVIGAVLFDLFMAIYILRDSCNTIGIPIIALFRSFNKSFFIIKMKFLSYFRK